MRDGAHEERAAGRRKAAGTLAMAAAVRAVDLICDAGLGKHSIAASHQVAIDLLATVEGPEQAVEDFSVCQTFKSGYNYHATEVDDEQLDDVMAAANALVDEALRRAQDNGWM